MPKQMAISFADLFQQELTCEVLVQSLYDLNHLEFKIYCTLVQIGKSDVATLMEKTERTDRTMVNRSLSTLLDKKLCSREKASQNGRRGYWFVYEATSLEILKERLILKLRNWYDHVTDEIKGIEARFDEVYNK